MTDRELAAALQIVGELEQAARAHWTTHQQDVPERDASLVVARQAGALKGPLERWMLARTMRAQRALSS